MRFIKLISEDFNRYVPIKNFKNILLTIFLSHSFHLVVWVRLGQLFRKTPYVGSFLGVFIEYFIRVIYASDISCKAQIAGGLMLIHGHDIVIGSAVVIGKNCKIFNGVTLGSKETELLLHDQPKIGDGVVIGTGAKVLGEISIGDGVKIGANSVVIESFSNNLVVVGVPAKMIKK